VFFRQRLIPRWLSVWGLVSVALTALGSVLMVIGVLGVEDLRLGFLNFSVLLQELALAAWLIIKGVAVPASSVEGSTPPIVEQRADFAIE
jgi:hypothetical protein